jgi:formylmethanofuran dehydrogenase subunit A
MILYLICKFRILFWIYANKSYTLDYSTNFPSTYNIFTAETAIKFELRESDILNKIGIAVLNNYYVFLGWIKKKDINFRLISSLN